MRDHEGIFFIMNAVVYYSNTGQSKRIAEYFAQRLDYPLFDVEQTSEREYDNLVLVFPVHCQNVPSPVRAFLQGIRVNFLIPIATYGKMWHGNVLRELQKKYPHRISAAAYLPTAHTYVRNDTPFEAFSLLEPIFRKTDAPSVVEIPHAFKNPIANVFPRLRSRIGVKIIKSEQCNDCGECSRICPLSAIENGKPNKRCIRCLRCVKNCPQNALEFRLRLPLRKYLKKKKRMETVIYV